MFAWPCLPHAFSARTCASLLPPCLPFKPWMWASLFPPQYYPLHKCCHPPPFSSCKILPANFSVRKPTPIHAYSCCCLSGPTTRIILLHHSWIPSQRPAPTRLSSATLGWPCIRLNVDAFWKTSFCACLHLNRHGAAACAMQPCACTQFRSLSSSR